MDLISTRYRVLGPQCVTANRPAAWQGKYETGFRCDHPRGFHADRIRTLILHTDRSNQCARSIDFDPSVSGARLEASDETMTRVVYRGSL